jgi:hypothetical protein
MEILDNIPVELDLEAVLRRLRLCNRNESIIKNVAEVLETARPVARPKAVYEVCYVEEKKADSVVVVGGITFTSRVLRANLDKVERVFPYVITCGRELESIEIPEGDFVKGYYMDQIKETALHLARAFLEEHLKKTFALGQVSRIAPGAGAAEDWPIVQQEGLFALFGGREKVEEAIGVRLTDSFLMVPIKSVSGFFFPTEVKFESCQICPREHCFGRRAPYDKAMAERYRAGVA